MISVHNQSEAADEYNESPNETSLLYNSAYRSSKGGQSSMILPKRKQSVRQPAAMDAIIISSIPPKHVHVGPGRHTTVTADLIEWMKEVDLREAPGCSVSSGPPRHIPESVILNGAKVQVNPGGNLFIREDRHYQLSIRLSAGGGESSSLHSCPSDKHGNIEDWFLIPMPESLDFTTAPFLEIGMERVSSDGNHHHGTSTIRSSVTAALMPRLKLIKARANELLSRTPSVSAPSSRKTSLKPDDVYALARFPLGMLLQGGLMYGTRDLIEIGGTFYLLRGGLAGWNRKAVGEISLHVTATPGSLAITWPTSLSNALNQKSSLRHQGYLTVQEGASRWRRTWAVLCQHVDRKIIQLTDYRRDWDIATGCDPESQIELADLTSLSATWEGHETGLMGLLVLGFEDGSFVYGIADTAKEMLEWANEISRAIWGQDYCE